MPLTLAATATAAGFMSFLPTDYKGLSELGLIAGLGMIIAFLVSITLLPALLKLFNPTGEEGRSAMRRSRRSIRSWSGIAFRSSSAPGVIAGGLPLLYYLQFDFNPMNLRSPKVESVATFLELSSDPTPARTRSTC